MARAGRHLRRPALSGLNYLGMEEPSTRFSRLTRSDVKHLRNARRRSAAIFDAPPIGIIRQTKTRRAGDGVGFLDWRHRQKRRGSGACCGHHGERIGRWDAYRTGRVRNGSGRGFEPSSQAPMQIRSDVRHRAHRSLGGAIDQTQKPLHLLAEGSPTDVGAPAGVIARGEGRRAIDGAPGRDRTGIIQLP